MINFLPRVCSFFAAQQAAVAEEKNISVTFGADRAIPIAVVPFGWQGGTVLPEDLATVIGNDLRSSGAVRADSATNMISLLTSAAGDHLPRLAGPGRGT